MLLDHGIWPDEMDRLSKLEWMGLQAEVGRRVTNARAGNAASKPRTTEEYLARTGS